LLHDVAANRWILVGEREDVRDELVGLVARRSMSPQLLARPILAVLIWLATGWGLAPLVVMANSIKSRAANNLTPLLLAPLPGELQPVVAALNRFLPQIAELRARAQRFWLMPPMSCAPRWRCCAFMRKMPMQDSGPGVSVELRSKLFARFFRQGMGQGAGLGLSIAQQVVELHGGSIELRDSPFAGLEVLVSLPRQA
jgi:hypothetical protein